MIFLQKLNQSCPDKLLTILPITPPKLSFLRNSFEGNISESETETFLLPELFLGRAQKKKKL